MCQRVERCSWGKGANGKGSGKSRNQNSWDSGFEEWFPVPLGLRLEREMGGVSCRWKRQKRQLRETKAELRVRGNTEREERRNFWKATMRCNHVCQSRSFLVIAYCRPGASWMRLAWRSGGLPWQLLKLGILHNGRSSQSLMRHANMHQTGPLNEIPITSCFNLGN